MKIAYWQINGDESLSSIFSRTLGHFDGIVNIRLFMSLDSAIPVSNLIEKIVPTLLCSKVIDTEKQIRTFCYHRIERQYDEEDRIVIIIQEVE